MVNHRHITVIIPALDEEESISRVIHDIPDCVDQILVVDNASQDATAARAAHAGARVVHEPQKGYGKACLTGVLVSGTLRGSLMAGYRIFYWIIRLAFSPKPQGLH